MEDMLRYLDDFVEPTITDFEAEPTCPRRAFLACVATFHSIDYLAYRRRSPAEIRQKLRELSPDFATVDRLAHAFKHVVTGHDRNPHIQPLHAANIISRPSGAVGEFAVGLSRVGDAVGGVTVASEPEIDILDAVRGALKILREWPG